MLKIILLAVTIGFISSGCDNKPTQEIDYGEINNGTYSNSYFNMSIHLPDTWAIQSQAAQQAIMQTGVDLISGEDNNLKQALKASEKQSVNMFAAFKYEQGTPVAFNPSIMAVAENVAQVPGIKRGSDYNYHVKNILQSGQLEYNFPDETDSEQISGVSFDIMHANIGVADTLINQKYYTTRINDYVLGFILSYSSEAEEKDLDDIMATLQFNK